MRLVTCPPPANLEQLLLGGLAEAEAEAVEQHVLECGSCLAELRRLSAASDTLAGLLRDDTESCAASSPAVVALIGKLKALRTAPQPAPAGVGDAPTQMLANTSDADRLANSLTDFLAPAQAGDELGRLGKYRILKVLGHGGMGVVYQAEDPQLKRTVALKAMLPALAASASARQRFMREAQAMAAVEHDHIVRVYQVDEDRGVPFAAMEFLKGQSLDERLKTESKLPVLEVLRIGREIAEALHAAHATGLIHRDIKPANIWLETRPVGQAFQPDADPRSQAGKPDLRGRVKLLDFGLVRAVSDESGLTQNGAILGTPAFMSPEQGRGDPVDERSDLFSLGVVLYRLSCGRQPFQGKDTVSTLVDIALREPPPPRSLDSGLPREFSELVMRLLEKDPTRRPASASEVVRSLQALEKQLARENDTAPPGAAFAASARPRRRRVLAVAGLALLAGLIGLALQAVIRIQTDQGDFVIKTDDPDFRFQVHKDGSVALEDLKAKRNYTLKVRASDKKSGEYELEVEDAIAELSFKTRVFTVKRGQTAALQAWFERKPPKLADPPAPFADARLREIAALSPQKQVEAVTAWLKECNPDFKETLTPTIEKDVVTELKFLAHHVTDLTPVRALPGLRKLECPGTPEKKVPLTNLAPLQGLKLTWLDCSNTNVSDLAPLKNMSMALLNIENTDVSDLAPLKDMPLSVLFAGGSKIADLAPLREMKLTIFHCFRTQVSTLAPLKDMKLTALDFHGTQIDLAPLKDMKLTELDCHGTQVSSLAPLKDMKLVGLNCAETQISDLTPLKEMKLRDLWCDDTQVSELAPLKDMRLISLRISGTQVSSLTPLKDMKLKELWCQGSQVDDLSPLKAMPLQEIFCEFKAERDAPILRAIKSLEKINGKTAQEFWKEVKADKP